MGSWFHHEKEFKKGHTKKPVSIEFIWRVRVQRKTQVHARELDTGRPRGSCTEAAIGSLLYIKWDEYSLSGIRCQKVQLWFSLEFRLAPPAHGSWSGEGGGRIGCIWFSRERSWQSPEKGSELQCQCHGNENELWGEVWINLSSLLKLAIFGWSVTHILIPQFPREQLSLTTGVECNQVSSWM